LHGYFKDWIAASRGGEARACTPPRCSGREFTQPSTAIHVACSGGAACSFQHTACVLPNSARLPPPCVDSVGSYSTQYLATRARWHVDAVNEHHAPLVHGSRSCSVHTLVLLCCFVPPTGMVVCSIVLEKTETVGAVSCLVYSSSKYGSSQSWRPRPDARTAGLGSGPWCGQVWDGLSRES
jgi:hypothetical protein